MSSAPDGCATWSRTTGWSIAESGVREPATVARWRALGFDGALVGEALVRAGDPAAAARAFVAAGAAPDDPANVARRPFVKICGVTDAAGVLAAVAAGADAIGLNLVPGTPRALDARRGRGRSRGWRATAGAGDRRPRVVAITADADRARIAGDRRGRRPRRRPAQRRRAARRGRRASGGRTWKVLHLPAAEPATLAPRRRRRRVARPGLPRRRRRADPPRHGRRAASGRDRARAALGALAAAIAREVPVILAGGLDPANVAGALRAIPADRRRRRLGRRAAARSPGERPRKDPFRVALFVKRARAARDDRPNLPFGPTPVHPGLLDADGAGRWGMERDFGGRYVPETLMAALEQLETAYDALRQDPVFWAELRELLGDVRRSPDRRSTAPTGWPTPSAPRPPGWPPRRGSRGRADPGACGSTSSARTSPTPAPTRSTTRSARRC